MTKLTSKQLADRKSFLKSAKLSINFTNAFLAGRCPEPETPYYKYVK